MRNPICVHKICEMTTFANPSMLSKPLYPGHFHLIDWHDRLLYLAWTYDFSAQICPSGMMIDRLGNLNNRTKTNKNLMTGWWFGTFLIFHHIWVVILPIDELIFFRGVAQPPTSNELLIIFWDSNLSPWALTTWSTGIFPNLYDSSGAEHGWPLRQTAFWHSKMEEAGIAPTTESFKWNPQ